MIEINETRNDNNFLIELSIRNTRNNKRAKLAREIIHDWNVFISEFKDLESEIWDLLQFDLELNEKELSTLKLDIGNLMENGVYSES